ncbi:MAG: FAD-binding protein [Gemmatimonadota bacterium]|nr:FAD-binding protein [Gemmatimonadota bacterium]
MFTTLAARLRENVEGPVRFDALTRGLYSTDASIYQIDPIGVVLPRTADDIAATMAIAREEGVPVLPRGAGTSQCGQAIGRALVVDTSRYLRRVGPVDREGRTVRVEPGVVLDRLNRRLAPTGLFFPVDVATASRATIGGMAGNNSGGARSIRYGIMADNVLAIEAMLPDGRAAVFARDSPPETAGDLIRAVRAIASREADELERRIPKVLRHVAGYNLHRLLRPGASPAELLVGSEGTLAFFRRIQLKLSRRPARRVLGVCAFPSLLGALDAVQHIVELDPHAVELIDHTLTGLARENAAFRSTVDALFPPAAHTLLLVEFAGDEEGALAGQLSRLEHVVRGIGPGCEVICAEDPAAQTTIWAVRRAGLNIVMSMKGDRKPVSIVEDCAVPLPVLAEFGGAVEEIFARHGTGSTWYAHASVGCLHVRPSLDMKDPADIRAFRAIAEEVHGVVGRLGGSHSGEHGDGILRSEFIEPVLGRRLARAFEEVKHAFDPEGMMNPGKIVGAPRMDDRELFRYWPEYPRRVELPTVGDWSESGGFARAVEACNNNGACRKMDPGVMCPSYRVTREERDTTRGRANVLRLAMTGQLGGGGGVGRGGGRGVGGPGGWRRGSRGRGLAGDEVAEAMELCVGCKACKRECPAGVDMARMKAEVMHLRNRQVGIPLRERLFASLPRIAPVAARAPGLFNLRNRSRVLRWAGERALGIAAERALPEWQGRPFRDGELGMGGDGRGGSSRGVTDSVTDSPMNLSASGVVGGGKPRSEGPVTLFVDTFTRYFDPNVARAARDVLRRLGYDPVAPRAPTRPRRPLCCGRTWIAAGLLDHARAEVRRTLDALVPLVRRGIPVVGLEPSCLLTLRDEALHLCPGDDARLVADQAFLVDEFLASRHATPPVSTGTRTEPDGADSTVWIHGHCHQKAAGTESATTTALTALLPGTIATPIQSSCCGMAGSFGYTATHLHTSRAMGELGIFPALRAAAPSDVVVANGFSCRAQIRDGTGRRAQHLVEVLAGQIGG